ncbi:hypothetical protein CC86DRAFT_416470 [Ophiobolus disseminans]|uniref:Uncharacterized protein n=1 Tax=Ophiobolus disseminans TaxID=1469910 RepID=A0A6A7A1W9_9PLEO|nr:hypothetical protein CC86DRAFT_416470 [Ophiobolus disseminans]
MQPRRYTTVPSLPDFPSGFNPLFLLFIWRCSEPKCCHINETVGSEGNELHQPCWYREKCSGCGKEATLECCLMQIMMLNLEEVGDSKVRGDEVEKEIGDGGEEK